MTEGRISNKQLKRTFITTRKHKNDLQSALEDLLNAQAFLPPGLLGPAIDALYDLAEAAIPPFELAAFACRERGIRSVDGTKVPHSFYKDDLNTNEIEVLTPDVEEEFDLYESDHRPLDARARGPNPRERVAVPGPGERCPRCHTRARINPCGLCNPPEIASK